MDKSFLKIVNQKAIDIIDAGGGPFGALVVKDGEIISLEGNRVTRDNDPTAHAEVLAIRKAAGVLKTWDLSSCEIYCSCEPCPMCLGAIYWARIPVIYYSATQKDAKDAGFDDSDFYDEFSLQPDQRKVKMINIRSDNDLQCFDKSKSNTDKRLY